MAEDFFRNSITSTSKSTPNKYIGNTIVEKAAKHQSVAPNCFITFAVRKPLNHEVIALKMNASTNKTGRKNTFIVTNVSVNRKAHTKQKT